MSRTTARNVAMQLLYEAQMGGGGGWDTVANLIELPAGATITNDDRLYVETILKGVKEREEELDQSIAPHLRDWTVDRLSRLDLCILRLSAYEMIHMHGDVPRRVSVNEAVELANTYSAPESGPFINGVLGTLLRELDEREKSGA